MFKALLLVFPILFFLYSCSTNTVEVNRAIARRSLQAASEVGASSSPCASRYYYEAERTLRSGEQWYISKNKTEADIDYFFKKATLLAEQAEQEAVFCGQ